MTTHLLVPRRTGPALSALAWSDLDRLFDRLFTGVAAVPGSDAAAFVPRIDFAETDSELRLAAELPGLDEKDIEVSLEDGVLTLRGERALDEDGEEAGVRHRETLRGAFQRSLRLPAEVDANAVTAVYRNGILTVTLPKAPEARVRNIPVTQSA